MQIKVVTHSGIEDVVEVDKYDPEELLQKLNSNDVQNILLGRKIYSRIDIKYVSEITAP